MSTRRQRRLARRRLKAHDAGRNRHARGTSKAPRLQPRGQLRKDGTVNHHRAALYHGGSGSGCRGWPEAEDAMMGVAGDKRVQGTSSRETEIAGHFHALPHGWYRWSAWVAAMISTGSFRAP